MSKMRAVSNEEYELHIKNVEYLKIAQSVTKKFKNSLEPDILKRCYLIGLWNALAYHREGFHKKFETSLHEWVYRQCCAEMSALKKDARTKDAIVKKKNAGFDEPEEIPSLFLEDLKKEFNEEELLMLIDCYSNKKSVRELAENHNFEKSKIALLKKKLKEYVNER